jgi:hypothetical protein
MFMAPDPIFGGLSAGVVEPPKVELNSSLHRVSFCSRLRPEQHARGWFADQFMFQELVKPAGSLVQLDRHETGARAP